MNEKREWPKIIGCASLLLALPLAAYIGMNLMWMSAVSPANRMKMDTEDTAKAIQNARETGRLYLHRPWFFGSRKFYAGKMFEMIRGLPGVDYLYLNGYPGVPIPAEAVAAVAEMPDLEELCFHIVHFESKAFLEMRRASKLKSLQLNGCEVDGDDLKCLAELTELRTLKIYWPLPNAKAETREFHQMPPEEQKRTVESLCKLTQLKELVLEESFREDFETLKQYLPDTKITFESIGYDIP